LRRPPKPSVVVAAEPADGRALADQAEAILSGWSSICADGNADDDKAGADGSLKLEPRPSDDGAGRAGASCRCADCRAKTRASREGCRSWLTRIGGHGDLGQPLGAVPATFFVRRTFLPLLCTRWSGCQDKEAQNNTDQQKSDHLFVLLNVDAQLDVGQFCKISCTQTI
jgi:hypothetical protein